MIEVHYPEVVQNTQADTDYDADSDLLPHDFNEIPKFKFTSRHTTDDQRG